MKLTKTQLKKIIEEELAKTLRLPEGEVIPFPSIRKEPEDTLEIKDIEMVVTFEYEVADMLAEIYGGNSRIPTKIIEMFDSFVNAIERSFEK